MDYQCIISLLTPERQRFIHNKVLGERNFFRVSTIVSDFILEEMKQDIQSMELSQVFEKYTEIAKAVARVTFHDDIREKYNFSTASSYKRFGVQSIAVIVQDYKFKLYLDECCVVYQSVGLLCTLVWSFGQFFDRIVRFHGTFSNWSALSSYNNNSIKFFSRVQKNAAFQKLSIVRFHRNIKNKHFHICIIIVTLKQNSFFVTCGVDSAYYLCAEAQAMGKAVAVVDNEETERYAIQQCKIIDPLPDSNDDGDGYDDFEILDMDLNTEKQNIEYIKVFVNQKRYFYLALTMARWENKEKLITFVNTKNKASVENGMLKKLLTTVKAIRHERWEEDCFDGF